MVWVLVMVLLLVVVALHLDRAVVLQWVRWQAAPASRGIVLASCVVVSKRRLHQCNHLELQGQAALHCMHDHQGKQGEVASAEPWV